MSVASHEGWWLASDGLWYPPELRPGQRVTPPPGWTVGHDGKWHPPPADASCTARIGSVAVARPAPGATTPIAPEAGPRSPVVEAGAGGGQLRDDNEVPEGDALPGAAVAGQAVFFVPMVLAVGALLGAVVYVPVSDAHTLPGGVFLAVAVFVGGGFVLALAVKVWPPVVLVLTHVIGWPMQLVAKACRARRLDGAIGSFLAGLRQAVKEFRGQAQPEQRRVAVRRRFFVFWWH